jgi:hypothetical protein
MHRLGRPPPAASCQFHCFEFFAIEFKQQCVIGVRQHASRPASLEKVIELVARFQVVLKHQFGAFGLAVFLLERSDPGITEPSYYRRLQLRSIPALRGHKDGLFSSHLSCGFGLSHNALMPVGSAWLPHGVAVNLYFTHIDS